jgi:hypothetical protein
VKRLVLALSALAIIGGVSACGGTPAPATNAQAFAAGFKAGDTESALYGYLDMLGNGVKLSTSSLNIYCEVAEMLKGGINRKWLGHGQVSVTLGNEWQSGCASGIGAEAKANTP